MNHILNERETGRVEIEADGSVWIQYEGEEECHGALGITIRTTTWWRMQ